MSSNKIKYVMCGLAALLISMSSYKLLAADEIKTLTVEFCKNDTELNDQRRLAFTNPAKLDPKLKLSDIQLRYQDTIVTRADPKRPKCLIAGDIKSNNNAAEFEIGLNWVKFNPMVRDKVNPASGGDTWHEANYELPVANIKISFDWGVFTQKEDDGQMFQIIAIRNIVIKDL